MNKFLKLICSITLALSLSACSMAGLDARSLISPPKANEDQQAIHNLMNEYESGNNSFVYPKSGDYRSAIIVKDLDKNMQNEAIGFLDNMDGGINVLFMKEYDGVWENIGHFSNTATQIYSVCFGDLDGDGVEEIIIGWGAPQSLTATISVFQYKDEQIFEFALDHTYNEFVITDLDDDGIEELFTATIFIASEEEGGKDQNAVARVFCFDEKPVLKYSCVLNNSATKYTLCNFTNITQTEKAVVLESVSPEGNYETQIITFKNKKIYSCLSTENNVSNYKYFLRPNTLQIPSKDINNDNIIEIPLVSRQIYYSDSAELLDATCYNVDWVNFDPNTNKTKPVMRMIMSTTDNFYFEVNPERQIYSAVTGVKTYTIREVKMLGNSFKTIDLFTIKMFSQDEWKKTVNLGQYEMIMKTPSNVICAVEKITPGNDDIIDTIKIITE